MIGTILLAALLSGTGWEFSKDSTNWTAVTVPHDWAIGGPFDPKASGWQGKLPWKGEGRYRRTFELDDAERKTLSEGGVAYLEFDGVMASPRVRLNGTEVGGWDYGYLGFTLDVTKVVKPEDNLLEVSCSTKDHASRWYPGAGIYRNVRLVVRPKDHVVPGSLRITTDVGADGRATVRAVYVSGANGPETKTFVVEKPHLWSLDDPYLYTLELKGEAFRYGIRTFRFDADKGFFLNGKRVQLKGVDLHSDLGPLGMAFDRDAMKRQLLIMRDMGFNALRTSHNAPDPQVLDLCDEMGVFVWDECFDKWEGTSGRPKGENLEAYVVKNLRQFVRRDRNHPSVFVWSIGNEIWAYHERDAGGKTGTTPARMREFADAVRAEDATRPVGIGCCHEQDVKIEELFDALDITGWNYGEKYKFVKERYPAKPVLYTESASAVSEYGYYELPPARDKLGYSRDTLQVGSYDHCAAPWSDIPDWEFARMARDTYCGGEFVWTGIDYLGEPTPIANGKEFGISTNNEVLARSSYFGIVDLCGIPKDRFYLYRSHWNPTAKTIHILPHWNWSQPPTNNHQPTTSLPVYVYTSGDSAELFLNGRSLGLRRKNAPAEPVAGATNGYYDVMAKYRLRWASVPYEPGELKVVAYRDGKVLGEETMRTAGKPVAVRLTDDPYNAPDAKTRFVQVDVVDEKGTRDPLATSRIAFKLTGPGEIVAVGNGNPKGYDSFTNVVSHPLHYGKCVAVVRRTGAGRLVLTASAKGLADAVFELPGEGSNSYVPLMTSADGGSTWKTACVGNRKLLIINEDNDHFFKYPASYMDEEHLKAYVDMLAEGGHVTHIHFCPTGGRASFDSKTWEPIWRGLDELTKEQTWFLFYRWATNAKALHDKGIDPYAVWIRRCREKGISPWLAPRMNDVHDAAASLTHFYRSTTFWRTHREYRLYPDYDKTSWYHHQFNYAHQAVRDDAFAMIEELFERYDFDGLSICGNAWFPAETAEASAPILSDFMRKIRKLADRWEKRRGHRIELAVQTGGSPEDCRKRGLDVGGLAREGVFDWVINDTWQNGLNVQVEKWREAFGGRDVKLIAGAHETFAAGEKEPYFGYEAAMYRGWADVVAARGVDGFHFWNLPYYPQEQYEVAHDGLDPQVTKDLSRSYMIVTRGRPPFRLDEIRKVETCVGADTNGLASVVLGFRDKAPKGLDVALNGVKSVWEREDFVSKYYYQENNSGREFSQSLGLQARRLFFPSGSVRKGANVITIAPTEDKAEVTYFELRLDPVRHP